MKLTSTNKPTTCHNTPPPLSGGGDVITYCTRPLCGSRETNRTHPNPQRHHQATGGRGDPVRQLDSVSAAIATGKRPAPFRTRKLSPSAPMVLPGRPGGRVGRRRTYFQPRRWPPNLIEVRAGPPSCFVSRGTCGGGETFARIASPGAHIWSAWSAPPRQGLGVRLVGALGVESRPVPAAGRCQRSCPLRGQSRLD